MNRGEIRWYTFRAPDKRRPVLVLARNDVTNTLNELIVVPVTRTVRGLATEVVLTARDGMPTTCALNFDHLSLAQRDRIGAPLCTLRHTRALAPFALRSVRASKPQRLPLALRFVLLPSGWARRLPNPPPSCRPHRRALTLVKSQDFGDRAGQLANEPVGLPGF